MPKRRMAGRNSSSSSGYNNNNNSSSSYVLPLTTEMTQEHNHNNHHTKYSKRYNNTMLRKKLLYFGAIIFLSCIFLFLGRANYGNTSQSDNNKNSQVSFDHVAAKALAGKNIIDADNDNNNNNNDNIDDINRKLIQGNNFNNNNNNNNGPLYDKFPSLRTPLQETKIILLYFAASWCPMSTPITNLLDELFQNDLLEPAKNVNFNDDNSNSSFDKLFSIVYVSSDQTYESFQSYIKPGWEYIPYDNELERNDLKRYFKTCAKKEMNTLQMSTRDYEIPNLIIINSKTQNIISYNAIQDIKTMKHDALNHWLDLHRLHNAIESKYLL